MIVESARPVAPAFPWAAPWVSVGVTGTKGKSTTTALVAAALGADGHPVLSATTVGYAIGCAPAPRPADWEAFLALAEEAQRRGCRRAAIELTSLALARGHARRWRFDVGVFTNLAEDHLHTHGSYEHYLASKAQLFIHLGPGRTAVLNAADPVSELLDQVIPADVERLWYASPGRGPALRTPALAADAITTSLRGTRIALVPSPLATALGGALEIAMIGEVFAEDALAAAGAALAAGISGAQVRAGIAAAPPLPGRFEVVADAPIVVVDYAHTADALARVCADARGLVGAGRLSVVFGAGGGTDPGKRGPMGEAAGRIADRVIITSDNPRDEDPKAIADALREGARRGGRAAVEVVLDRRAAIAAALGDAAAGDLVLIAGKGHEATQTIGGRTIPFSDRAVARAILGLDDE